MRHAKDTFVPFYKSVSTGADIKLNAQWARLSSWLSGYPTHQSERAWGVLKLTLGEPHIDDLMKGRPTPSLTGDVLQGNPRNLAIKTPKYTQLHA